MNVTDVYTPRPRLRTRLRAHLAVILAGVPIALALAVVLAGATFNRYACPSAGRIAYGHWHFNAAAWFAAAPIGCDNETFTQHLAAGIPVFGESISNSMGGPHYRELRQSR